jgi:hypothetical protein
MYRILIILSSIVLLATSCQKETSIDTPATLTYTVVPQVSFDVKSGTETINTEVNTEINSISYLVYHKKINAQGKPDYEYIEEMGSYKPIDDPTQISVPITLIKDQEYKLVFIAQHRFKSQQGTESYAYTYNNISKEMSVNPDAHFTNGDQLEAYVYVDEVGPITGNENRKITLNRIVSQINIGTNATTYPEKLKITVTGAPASYNVFEGTYAEDASSVYIRDIATPTSGTDKIKVSNIDYNRLATLYCLGNNKLTLTLTNTKDPKDAFTISNVSTQVNYKTNIVGNILAGTYTVQASNLNEFTSALANPKVTHIELTAPIIINSDITIDGRGVTVTQAANFENGVTSSNIRCIIKVNNSTVTLKNIKFNNTFDYPLIETSYSVLHAENLTVTGHNCTSSMIILRGFGSFTNCTFTDNHCGGNGILHYDSGDDETKGLTIHGCTFSNTAVKSNIGYVATLNIGPRRNWVITDNIIQNNTVESTATTQTITGGLLICCPATITGNTVTDNTPNNIYTENAYGEIDLSGNNWGEGANNEQQQ